MKRDCDDGHQLAFGARVSEQHRRACHAFRAACGIHVDHRGATEGHNRIRSRRSATRSAELCVRDPGDDPGYCGEPYTHPSTGNDRPVAEMIARLIAGALGADEADLRTADLRTADLRTRWSQSWS